MPSSPDATTVKAEKISELALNPTFSRYLQIVRKADHQRAQKAVDPSLAAPETLAFVSTPEQLQQALKGPVSILIALDKLNVQDLAFEGALYSTPSIQAAMALTLPLFDQKSLRFSEGIHPQAFVDPSAQIGKNVRIAPFAFIGAGAQIQDDVWVGPHAVVERKALIGARSILHPHTYIGADCKIGKFCEIHPHATIGSDGFGYVQGHDQRRHKIPQLGIVVLEDLVDIGAGTTIDRATLGETRIGEGSKLDNLCHVAHNCKIGRNNVFAAGFNMAGSSEIGDNCMVAGQVGVTDHVKIGSNITLGGRAGVTKDVTDPGVYAGFPLESYRDALRTLANLPQVSSLRKQVSRIQKHLGLKEESK